MTEFSMNPDRECVGEYITLAVYRGKTQKALRTATFLAIGLIAVAGIAAAVAWKQALFLGVTAAAILLGVMIPFLIRFVLKDSARQLSESIADKESETMIAAVSDMNLLFIRGGIPQGLLEWEDVTEITEGKTGFFLKTKTDALLILARTSVVSGSYDEAAQVLRAKKGIPNPPEKDGRKK